VSYAALEPVQRYVFRLLGSIGPVTFAPWLATALAGLDAPRAEELLRRYAPYSAEAPSVAEPGVLRVAVGLEERDYFVTPPERPEFNPVFLEVDGARIRYVGYKVAGWFDSAGDDGVLLLARGTYEPDLRAFENYVRAAVAWRAASLGGALVHAASAVRKDRAYLFYGESGAGKSTLAAVTKRATIVSDDLSLVLPGAEGLVLVGSPFRGTYEGGAPVEGSFPLAAGFRLIQAERAEVRPVSRAQALSEVVGNLPFVAEAFAARPDLFAAIEASFSRVPLAHLHFRKDDSYWDAIDGAGL
jgi:hypothetical protein